MFSCCYITLFLKCFTLHIKRSFGIKICVCLNFIDVFEFLKIKNCNGSMFWHVHVYMIVCMQWNDMTYIYIIQNQKLKKWKRQWKKNSERTRKRLKTWRKHGRRDCQSKKRQIRYQYIIPSFCTNSVLLKNLLAASVVIF